MTSSELTITAEDVMSISTARQDDAVERAFERAVRDSGQLGDLLAALCQGRLWLPLPRDGHPVTDGSAVHLPTVRYLGDTFVPAYTSAARLLRASEELAPGQRVTVVPHAVVRAADLARRLPPALGIALNPGLTASVPVYPPGVGQLAAGRAVIGGRQVSVGPLPAAPPAGLVAGLRAGLSTVRAAREGALAWLTVEPASAAGGVPAAGLIISVTLDDPAVAAARDAAIAAVTRAVTTGRGAVGWPVDLTFPGEGEPDVIDRWVATAAPFYQRSASLPPPSLPGPRPATD
jgi:hypothetical protein